MREVAAHIHNGQVVVDEQVELPEGELVSVLIPDPADELTPEELEELDEAAEEGMAQFRRGECIDAHVVLARLAARL